MTSTVLPLRMPTLVTKNKKWSTMPSQTLAFVIRPFPSDTCEFLPSMRTLVRQHDAPVYTITYYAHWLLMESIAAHGYRIAVSGTAADELFTGYFDHHLAYLYEIRNEPELHAAARARPG